MTSIRFCGNLGPPNGIKKPKSSDDILFINPLFSIASFTLLYMSKDIGAPFSGGFVWQEIQLLLMMGLTSEVYVTKSGISVLSIKSLSVELVHEILFSASPIF